MPSPTLIFRGPIDLGQGTIAGEIWAAGTTAIAFQGGQQLAQLSQIVIDLTPDRRLRISGQGDDGPASWEATDPERIMGQWSGSTVAFPDGSWAGATVAWSQYAVSVSAPGHPARDLPAAHTEIVGVQRWIISGDDRIAASPARRGCGCGGGR